MGAVFTISIIFIFIGIPLLIIGFILMIISVLLFLGGTIDSFLSLFRLKQFKVSKEKPKKKRDRRKIIEVREKDGVYKAE